MSKKKLSVDRLFTGKSILPSVLLYALCAVCLAALITVCLHRKQYALVIGQAAPADIVAPQTVTDDETTEVLKENAKNAVAPVMYTDETRIQTVMEECASAFDAIEAARAEAEQQRLSTAPSEGEDARSWQVIISQEALTDLFSELPFALPEAALGYYMLSCEAEDIASLRSFVTESLNDALSEGITADTLQTVSDTVIKQLQTSSLSARQKQLGTLFYETFLCVTETEDAVATEKARTLAADTVSPVKIQKGAVIVRDGEAVTVSQYAVCQKLGLVKGTESGRVVAPFAIVLTSFLLILLLWQGLIYDRGLLFTLPNALFIAAVILLSTGLQFACYFLHSMILFTALPLFLLSAYFPKQVVEKINLLLSIVFGLLAGGRGDGMLGSQAVLAIIASIIGGEAVIVLLKGRNPRIKTVVISGAVFGIFAALLAVCAYVLTEADTGDAVIGTLLMLLCPFAEAGISVGISEWLRRAPFMSGIGISNAASSRTNTL